MKVFLTKKQKKLMRERRKKKLLFEKGVLVPGQTLRASNKTTNSSSSAAAVAVAAKNNVTKPQKSDDKNKNKKYIKDKSQEETEGNMTTTKNGLAGQKRSRQEHDKSPERPSSSSDASNHATAAEIRIPLYSNRITIPATLDAKEARKFRKEARRKARVMGRDETKLEFVTEVAEAGDHALVTKRKKRKFPCINELVEQEKRERQKREREEAQKAEEALLPEAIKKRYVAMDCEMVGIGSDGKKSALARVSLTDWSGNVLLDTFVKVPDHVTDFRTHVSGVKPKHLKSNAMDDKECREKVASLLKGKILVGHALKNDLDALLLQHPKKDIRDTAKYRPYQRFGGNKWRPRKLRDLAKEHCDLLIQVEGEAHDSVDDARAAMELYKHARKEWEEQLLEKDQKKKK